MPLQPEQYEVNLPYPDETEFDAPSWRIVITDLAGAPLGEIVDAYERKFHFALRSPETVECKLNLNNAMLSTLLSSPFIHLWKVYHSTQLMMVAETSSWDFVATEDGLTRCAFTATSCFWPRFAKRLIGKSVAGQAHSGDRGLFVADQLTALNATNDTKLRIGTRDSLSSVVISAWRYKPFLEAVQELAFTVNGFDFYTRPSEPDTGVVGYVDLRSTYGQVKPEAIFEYGDGRANLRDWSWKGSNIGRINTAHALPASYPDNTGLSPASATDATSQTEIGLREEVISTDIDDAALRALLCQEHRDVRKNARQIFTFNPHYDDGTGRVPQFGTDFGIGDIVEGRVNDNGLIWLNGQVRMYGVDIEVDENGRETTSFTAVPEEA